MSNFIINCGPWHSHFIPNGTGDEPEGGIIQIVSKQKKISIEPHNPFIFLDSIGDLSQTDKKDRYLLRYKGKVKAKNRVREANTTDLNPTEQNEYLKSRKEGNKPVIFFIHDLEVDFANTFKINPFLDDYTYSLQSIYSYDTPYRHFSKRFTSIDDFDFETLKSEHLYAVRTVFGRLFYSLPIENRLEFVQIAIQQFETANFTSVSIKDGLLLLRNYSRKITQLGKYLTSSFEILSTDFSDLVDPNEIGFGFEKKELRKEGEIFVPASDNIKTQIDLFQKSFELEDSVEETIKMLTSKDQDLLDERFKNQKHLKRWPIKINL